MVMPCLIWSGSVGGVAISEVTFGCLWYVGSDSMPGFTHCHIRLINESSLPSLIVTPFDEIPRHILWTSTSLTYHNAWALHG